MAHSVDYVFYRHALSTVFLQFQQQACKKEILARDHPVEEELERIMEERRQRLESVKENILIAQMRQKQQYDCKHSNPEVFAVGALVLKKDFTRKKRAGGKLDCKWTGPYRIVRSLGRGLYRLEDVQNSEKVVTRVNGIHLKRYIQKEVCLVE